MTLCTAEYTSQSSYTPDDLDSFFANFSKNQIGERPEFVSVDGGMWLISLSCQAILIDRHLLGKLGVLLPNTSHGESNLDLQYVMALVGSKQPVALYQVGDQYQNSELSLRCMHNYALR